MSRPQTDGCPATRTTTAVDSATPDSNDGLATKLDTLLVDGQKFQAPLETKQEVHGPWHSGGLILVSIMSN